MAELDWNEVRRAFHRDGALRDIYVLDVGAAELDRFLAALPAWGHALSYTERRVAKPWPDSFAAVYARRDEIEPFVAIDLGGVELHYHFFTDEELELDLDPREVATARELELVGAFLRRLGRLLERPVLLTQENLPDTPVLSYDPRTDCLAAHPENYPMDPR